MACYFARSLVAKLSGERTACLLQQQSRTLTSYPNYVKLLARPLTSVKAKSGARDYSTSVSTVTTNSNEDFKSTLKTINDDVETMPASKVFAVVHISGRQFKITKNDLILVHRMPADVGSEIVLEKVLLAASENFSLIGTPLLRKEVVRVIATVVEHVRLAKVIIFKKKRRKGYKKKKGHRQDMTTLRINDIKLNIDAINE